MNSFEKIQNFSKLHATQEDPTSSFDVTVDELKVVVGILLISGYNVVPRRRLYWSSETDVRNDMIARAMSRKGLMKFYPNYIAQITRNCLNQIALQRSDLLSVISTRST